MNFNLQCWSFILSHLILLMTPILAKAIPPNADSPNLFAKPVVQKCYHITDVSCFPSPTGQCISSSSAWIEHDSHDGQCGFNHDTHRCPLVAKGECTPKGDTAKCADLSSAQFVSRVTSSIYLGWCACLCIGPDGGPKRSPDDLTSRYDTEDGCSSLNAKRCKYWPDDYVIGEDARDDRSMLSDDGEIKCVYSFARPEQTPRK